MSGLGVSVVQYAPHDRAGENLRAMEPWVDAAVSAGSHLVVFPEYSHAFSPRLGEQWAARAEFDDGEFVQGLVSLSQRHEGIVIIAGVLLRSPSDERPANVQIAVGPEGILARAEKIHLYDAFGASESTWIRPGVLSSPQVVTIGGMAVGMMACYDLRFPEVARRLADAGAEVVVVPAQWVPGPHKAHHFDTLVAARAIETQCFLVASDHPAPHGVGQSQIVDPHGVMQVKAGETPDILHATLDSAILHEVRASNLMSTARRFGVSEL